MERPKFDRLKAAAVSLRKKVGVEDFPADKEFYTSCGNFYDATHPLASDLDHQASNRKAQERLSDRTKFMNFVADKIWTRQAANKSAEQLYQEYLDSKNIQKAS